MTDDTQPIAILTATLDGKTVAYCSQTEFLVQVGRGRGAYATRYRFVGNLKEAVFYYRAINVGRGYKKRLIAPSITKSVLARCIS